MTEMRAKFFLKFRQWIKANSSFTKAKYDLVDALKLNEAPHRLCAQNT